LDETTDEMVKGFQAQLTGKDQINVDTIVETMWRTSYTYSYQPK